MGIFFVPQDERTALGAPILLLLPGHPFLQPEVLHILKVLDDLLVVGNTVDDMYVFEFLQSFTGECITLETARDAPFPGTIAEAMLAVLAVRRQFIR
jgi:hypothetical protein